MMIEEEIERLSQTYAGKVLSRRTRVVSLLGRKCEPLILYTFLGFELKMARKRITCPDMSTARYLKIFAELGMPSIRIPYDPTQTSRLLVELELPLQRIKELLLAEKLKQRQHQLKHRRIYKKIRDRLKRAERKVNPR
ncbi:hypothetical protein MYX84_12695 [Acidobacteria bacterium AH-259-O06]|nr:hypothetical protein [Acidobacteria bacterium AH-259-O06]